MTRRPACAGDRPDEAQAEPGYHVSLAVATIVIGAVGVAISLTGLEPGHLLGRKTGDRGEALGSLVRWQSSATAALSSAAAAGMWNAGRASPRALVHAPVPRVVGRHA